MFTAEEIHYLPNARLAAEVLDVHAKVDAHFHPARGTKVSRAARRRQYDTLYAYRELVENELHFRWEHGEKFPVY